MIQKKPGPASSGSENELAPIPAAATPATPSGEDKPATLSKRVTEMLREEILAGVYKPGDALPSEREIAARLNVSRIPVREAIKSLEYLGIVRISRGNGVVVQSADLSNILRVVGPLVTSMTPELVKNLFDFRLLIEPYAAQQAAIYAGKEETDRLAAILKSHEQAIANHEPVEEISFEFHLALMQASRNEVISIVSTFLSELQRYSRHWTLWNDDRRRNALEGHKRILDAILMRNPPEAYRSMYEHLIDSKDVLTIAPGAEPGTQRSDR